MNGDSIGKLHRDAHIKQRRGERVDATRMCCAISIETNLRNSRGVMRQRNPGDWPPPAGLAPSQAALVSPVSAASTPPASPTYHVSSH
ncbi:unnamed protein product [Arctia plantaginis]|uniref:Uncharacterized protein n=1 Tax=Arctia plantaginis TaxID=874455 RepID=A0A8S1BDR2_ARCPL|nr:unnamed protein product [Arctia plantaginis]